MTAQPQSIYQRVIDKTKPVAFQGQLIAQSVEKRLEMQRLSGVRWEGRGGRGWGHFGDQGRTIAYPVLCTCHSLPSFLAEVHFDRVTAAIARLVGILYKRQ